MIRWGLIGPGSIASGFAEAMQLVDGGAIVAVASRAAERAEAFGDRFAIPTRYGDYDSLAADPDVDVVYVATPHSRHEEDTLNVLRAGKHVCARAARAQRPAGGAHGGEGVEPGNVPDGGDLEQVLAGLPFAGRSHRRGSHRRAAPGRGGFRVPPSVAPDHRHFARELGGGALLDLGIYPVQLCTLVLGQIERVVADAVVGRPESTRWLPPCCTILRDGSA